MKLRKRFSAAILLLILPISTLTQTGGAFTVTQSVIAAGGGRSSTSGAFSIDGTIGQSLAGTTSTGGAFTVGGGFWTPAALVPTAAPVAVGGRVQTADGAGIRHATVTLIDSSGAARTVQTGKFGSFRFDDVPVGEMCIVIVAAKRFTFKQTTQVVSVVQETDEIIFTANENGGLKNQ